MTSLAAAAALCCLAATAEARPARCFSSDEGHYRCDFRAAGKDGSFVVSARGKPTYMVNIGERSGVAWVHADFGTGRNVALPGPYLRSADDPACWAYEGKARLCAW